jgi:hypothetical protein
MGPSVSLSDLFLSFLSILRPLFLSSKSVRRKPKVQIPSLPLVSKSVEECQSVIFESEGFKSLPFGTE